MSKSDDEARQHVVRLAELAAGTLCVSSSWNADAFTPHILLRLVEPVTGTHIVVPFRAFRRHLGVEKDTYPVSSMHSSRSADRSVGSVARLFGCIVGWLVLRPGGSL